MKNEIHVGDVTTATRGIGAALILTDPPHLDQFGMNADDHRDFVHRWRVAVAPCAPILVHSCGPHPAELRNYLMFGVPDQLFVWKHPEANVHHYYLVYGGALNKFVGIQEIEKPYPFYDEIILTLTEPGDVVLDPFCGKGEIPIAAMARGRYFHAFDISATQVAAAKAAILRCVQFI